jgi:hypothetical protein
MMKMKQVLLRAHRKGKLEAAVNDMEAAVGVPPAVDSNTAADAGVEQLLAEAKQEEADTTATISGAGKVKEQTGPATTAASTRTSSMAESEPIRSVLRTDERPSRAASRSSTGSRGGAAQRRGRGRGRAVSARRGRAGTQPSVGRGRASAVKTTWLQAVEKGVEEVDGVGDLTSDLSGSDFDMDGGFDSSSENLTMEKSYL